MASLHSDAPARPVDEPEDRTPEVRETSDPGPRRRVLRNPSLVHAGVASVIAVVAALVSFKLRTVPVPTDPWHYVRAGMTFPDLSWNTVGLTRYGVVLPMILVTHFFKDGELSYYVMPCIATGVVIGCTYWLTARFFGWVAGLAAAVLVIANSVMLVNASRLYPDPVAMAMVMLAVIAAILARDRWARTPRVDAWLVVLLVLVGTFVGLSWWMRETALLEWPVVAAVLLWRGGPPRKWSIPLAAVPAAALLALEMVISARAFGSPMERFTALTSGDLSSTTNPADMPYLNQSRFAYLTTMPRGFLGFEDGRWMLAMAAIALVSLIVAPRKTGLFAGWFVVVFLLFTAVGGGLRPAHPNIRLDVARYWVAYLPPMVMAAVAGSTLALRRVRSWLEGRTPARVAAIVPGVVALLLVAGAVNASAAGVRANPSYVVTNGNVTASFRNWLHAHDKHVRVVYSDWMSGRVLPVYAESFSGKPMAHATFLSLTGARPPHRGDYVVLYSPYDQVCFFCNANLNMTWLKDHRADLHRWTKVWQSADRTFVVYRVTGRAKR